MRRGDSALSRGEMDTPGDRIMELHEKFRDSTQNRPYSKKVQETTPARGSGGAPPSTNFPQDWGIEGVDLREYALLTYPFSKLYSLINERCTQQAG